MCSKKGAFVDEKNFDVIEMHGTTIKIYSYLGKVQRVRRV
jgi:hypothetical protein